MSNMCRVCGAELVRLNKCKEKQENGNSIQLNGKEPVMACKHCGEKQNKDSVKQDGLSPYATPLISPTASLTSSDSIVSSCSDFSVDVNSYGRDYQEESSTDSSHEDLNFRPNAHVQNSSLHPYVNDKVNNRCTARVAEIVATGNGQVRENDFESANEEAGISHSFDDETDAQIWEPPQPEDKEDDMDGSVASYDDDDDEFGDGTKWGKPSCLSSFAEEGSGSYRYKEEKQKAMNEVMHGKFKALVSQLLKSVGVTVSREDGDSWVDIVTSLSWEAASFVKPDAFEGKAMDPDGYVKIKCIATGSCSQSQVVRGLVFKKHAAHKHMPTKYKNPRLLLIRGALGSSSSELSSFESMQQEKDSLKSIIEMIETCHPNVVLVEKTVSRDVQESILAKGMTLVLDMKLHRLERVARCTGSSILSSDILTGQKLKHCDSFYFEKFVEEHNVSGEGGKRPSKTLMFLVGCPTRLGCTILLKGTQSDELKRIKCVVQCAVVMAYHLILETSFLLDQRAMFCTIPFNGVANLLLNDLQSPSVGSGDSNVSCLEEPSSKTDSSCTIEIPISNGFHEEGSHNLNLGLEGNSTLSYEPYNPVILSGLSSLSASLKKVIEDSFPLFSSSSHQSMSTYYSLGCNDSDNRTPTTVQVSTSPEANDHSVMEAKGSSDEEKELDREQPNSPSTCKIPLDAQRSGVNDDDQMQSKNDISKVLDSESILVLMSSRNASRGTICEQSHFSHIKFYRNFDVPLGKFLRDNLLNQRLRCTSCGEPPEAHFYYYAHHNKQLTIQVKRLSKNTCLPGEAEGKLWMWSRCSICRPHNGNSRSTKRVLLSTAARCLSFGKFLELSFSNQFSFSSPSSCGHSLQRDFLYFFGLGPMAAMLRYSPVATYSVSVPPQRLEFSNSIRPELLKKESENVYSKGILLFTQVAKSLHKIESQFPTSSLNFRGSLKELSDIQEMLKQERSEFEMKIQNNVIMNGSGEVVYKHLYLNRILWELLLESCIWDRRLHSLLLSADSSKTRTTDTEMQGCTHLKEDGTAGGETDMEENTSESVDNVSGNNADMKMELGTSVDAQEFPTKEIPIEGPFQGSREQDEPLTSSIVARDINSSNVGSIDVSGSFGQDFLVKSNISAHSRDGDENCQAENLPSSARLVADRTIPIMTELGDNVPDLDVSQRGTTPFPLLSNGGSFKGWVWTPFPEIREEYMKDIQKGYLPKFEFTSSNLMGSLPVLRQLITEEGSRLHIPLGTDDYIVSDYEGEFSSIIACALALLKDLPLLTEDHNDDTRKERGFVIKAYENSPSMTRISSLTSPHLASAGSLDSDGIHSSPSFSSEESNLSFDGSRLLESLVYLGALHPEVFMGVEKLSGKGKYSVVCLYASQFRDLRNRCCPSELDYIASLSRCRNWDAKGGKSKSFFAKTFDDRFIIKEIKRTEFDSFVKFAQDYFGYMNQCYELGNQTCLAKILGIYQVTIRQTKSGKEMKHELMVMENLSFGRNITRQYDLKGALHARFNAAADGSEDVLLDQNFVNDMNASPLYVSRRSKRLLQRGVWNDTTFLNSINVMDYSLLVGVDTQRRELVCGIIDYLRQYTLDKQFETWIKYSLVPKNQLPTVISPKEYKKRFRKFMSIYFLSVPDHWCSQRSSNPCKLCGIADYDSSDYIMQKQGDRSEFST
ncbi:putative 1-phosphatidylinositol-3-phosphate 5-kinase FAB1D [Cornus florida]|uniref:putative 1-phosphatidylinositol-3-phosphate 5-kinase FAB1D n=1 Tax=Cornus florida TaxID=4283 RepID=UPI00289C7B77|nr:putative 1-phosphatidylinositol-3-phosphate 5-kinase FAB1D [Cornus florida]XP_059631893.1 putative 1-phosphatidylinositol-3-phosphate 5-kinase FAB1D [Cornus florida]